MSVKRSSLDLQEAVIGLDQGLCGRLSGVGDLLSRCFS
jgi:hypothetical protein